MLYLYSVILSSSIPRDVKTEKNMKQKHALKRPKQKRSRERVQLILNSTRAVLKENGVRALSTNSIAARAGIPVSSIYQYFPNKEAILLGLYEDYLADIRAVYEEMDTESNHALPWREFLTKILHKLYSAEAHDNLERELEVALGLYPELIEADRRHEEWITNQIVKSMQRLGAQWSAAKLKRLAYYLYELNSTAWSYKTRHNPPKKELLEWRLASFFSVAEKCFE